MDRVIAWYEAGELVDSPSIEKKYEGDLAETFKRAVADSKDGKQIVTF